MKNTSISTATARRVQLAASLAAGHSVTDTARQLGISREWASKLAKAPETQQIIAMLVSAHLERFEQLFDEALTVIKKGFRARRRAMVKSQSSTLDPITTHVSRRLGS